jgi:hypothetical protein
MPPTVTVPVVSLLEASSSPVCPLLNASGSLFFSPGLVHHHLRGGNGGRMHGGCARGQSRVGGGGLSSPPSRVLQLLHYLWPPRSPAITTAPARTCTRIRAISAGFHCTLAPAMPATAARVARPGVRSRRMSVFAGTSLPCLFSLFPYC